MHISVYVSLQYIICPFLAKLKSFFPKRFLFQPNYLQISFADTMIVNLKGLQIIGSLTMLFFDNDFANAILHMKVM